MNLKTGYRNLDVLIVEDELDICYLLSGILKKRNFNACYVTSLFAAEKQIRESIPDILIIDNHLPDGYGVDFIARIKGTHPGIKVVMMTAHDTGNDKQGALKKGADCFIGKPFTSQIIMETLDSLLEIT